MEGRKLPQIMAVGVKCLTKSCSPCKERSVLYHKGAGLRKTVVQLIVRRFGAIFIVYRLSISYECVCFVAHSCNLYENKHFVALSGILRNAISCCLAM